MGKSELIELCEVEELYEFARLLKRQYGKGSLPSSNVLWNRISKLPLEDQIALFKDLREATLNRLAVFERKQSRSSLLLDKIGKVGVILCLPVLIGAFLIGWILYYFG